MVMTRLKVFQIWVNCAIVDCPYDGAQKAPQKVVEGAIGEGSIVGSADQRRGRAMPIARHHPPAKNPARGNERA